MWKALPSTKTQGGTIKMANNPKTPGSLTTKHWFGYMFGDWGGCMTFALMSSISPSTTPMYWASIRK